MNKSEYAQHLSVVRELSAARARIAELEAEKVTTETSAETLDICLDCLLASEYGTSPDNGITFREEFAREWETAVADNSGIIPRVIIGETGETVQSFSTSPCIYCWGIDAGDRFAASFDCWE